MSHPTAIVPHRPEALTAPGEPSLVAAFLAGRSPRTLRAYGEDLRDFATFAGFPPEGLEAATAALLGAGQGEANRLALAYRAHLLERGLAPATVNRRLAALRSLVTLARTLGRCPWTLEVPSVASESYRDTAGPGAGGVRQLLGLLAEDDSPKATRDRALLRLLADLALRRAEAVALDVEDVDLEAGTVTILGKGRREPERLTLPSPTRAALAAWLAIRGASPGPLFPSLDRARPGHRLTGHSVYRIVQALGRRVGLTVRPHGLRHAAITTALDANGGNLRATQRFSRHRDVRTLQRYDDNRADLAGETARLVAGHW